MARDGKRRHIPAHDQLCAVLIIPFGKLQSRFAVSYVKDPAIKLQLTRDLLRHDGHFFIWGDENKNTFHENLRKTRNREDIRIFKYTG